MHFKGPNSTHLHQTWSLQYNLGWLSVGLMFGQSLRCMPQRNTQRSGGWSASKMVAVLFLVPWLLLNTRSKLHNQAMLRVNSYRIRMFSPIEDRSPHNSSSLLIKQLSAHGSEGVQMFLEWCSQTSVSLCIFTVLFGKFWKISGKKHVSNWLYQEILEVVATILKIAVPFGWW